MTRKKKTRMIISLILVNLEFKRRILKDRKEMESAWHLEERRLLNDTQLILDGAHVSWSIQENGTIRLLMLRLLMLLLCYRFYKIQLNPVDLKNRFVEMLKEEPNREIIG